MLGQNARGYGKIFIWLISYNYDKIIKVIIMKQIYAALEINSQEIRILVGEYFNTRFNIIKLETAVCEGIEDYRIVNHEKVKESVSKAINDASKMLGAKIEKVILLIPPYNFKRYPLKVNVKTNNGYVSKADAARVIQNAMHTKIDNDLTIINAVCVKYTVNGISSRRLPEKEISDELIVDIDLLCADKILTFDYVSLLEDIGIQIMDICMNIYAICKEAALFEQTLNQNIVLVNVNHDSTELALLQKGKLVNAEILFDGFDSIVLPVQEKYHIAYATLSRLIKYNTSYDKEYIDDAIYAWVADDGNNISINEQTLSNDVYLPLKKYIDKLVTSLKPILESHNTAIVVTGELASMESFIYLLSKECKTSVKAYFPDTIGVRDSSLTALYGSFFVYKDMVNIKDLKISSINLLEFENIVDRRSNDVEGESLTGKIKNLFEMDKKGR